MSRELQVQVIRRKRALYHERHDLALQTLAIEEEIAYASPEIAPVLQQRLLQAKDAEETVQLRLRRAQLFGQEFAKSLVPSICLTCYVDDDLSAEMIEIESRLGNGIRRFKCERCGVELSIEPPIG